MGLGNEMRLRWPHHQFHNLPSSGKINAAISADSMPMPRGSFQTAFLGLCSLSTFISLISLPFKVCSFCFCLKWQPNLQKSMCIKLYSQLRHYWLYGAGVRLEGKKYYLTVGQWQHPLTYTVYTRSCGFAPRGVMRNSFSLDNYISLMSHEIIK